MGVACGSQVVLCEYPIHLDTYRGCSHDCKYCFARAKRRLENIEPLHCVQQVKDFIEGKRSVETNWCDWEIPLHWGSLSDPFQPAEKHYKASLEVLHVFAETGYPFIVSTKGKLIAEEPYLSLLSRCNAVFQISMTSPMLDVIEPGAPTFEERLALGRTLASHCKRLIARVQPYMPKCKDSLIAYLPQIKAEGFYGITVEGMKFRKSKPGLVRVEGDFCYPEQRLRYDYFAIREKCADAGLHFWCAENRLRGLGESTACCGCGDLPGFTGNGFNCASLHYRKTEPTEQMKKAGTASCFKGIYQGAGENQILRTESFYSMMVRECTRITRNESKRKTSR